MEAIRRKFSSDDREKASKASKGNDKRNTPTADILCVIEDIPAIGSLILSKFKYLGEFISDWYAL